MIKWESNRLSFWCGARLGGVSLLHPGAGAAAGVAGSCLQPGGWVQEILIAGPEQKVQMMLGWLEHGPRTATVTRMECANALPPTGSGFHTN